MSMVVSFFVTMLISLSSGHVLADTTLTLDTELSVPLQAAVLTPSLAVSEGEATGPSFYAEAYVSQDSRRKYGDNTNETYHELQGFMSYGGDVGLWAYAYSSWSPKAYNSYQEGYAGLYVRQDWFDIGLGYGAESYPEEEGGKRIVGGRFGGYAEVYLGKATISSAVEDGKSGWYFEHRAGYQLTDQLYVGGEWYQHLGAGPSFTLSHDVSEGVKARFTTSYLFGRGDELQPTNTLKIYFELIFGG